MVNFRYHPRAPPFVGTWADYERRLPGILRGGTRVGTKYQRGKKRGGFNIKDLNPVRVAKAGRKKGMNLVKRKITKIANKKVKQQLMKHGKRMGVSAKAVGKVSNALSFILGEQLDKRIKQNAATEPQCLLRRNFALSMVNN